MKATYLIQKGVILDLEPMYSFGRSRKKYSITIISNSAWSTGSFGAVAMLVMFLRTCRVAVLTHIDVGS